MIVPEQGRPLTTADAEAEQLAVQGIGEIAGAGARLERVGRSIEPGTMIADEALPRVFVPGRARAGECQVFEMQRPEIELDVA